MVPSDHIHHSEQETYYFGREVPFHHMVALEVVIVVSVLVLDRTSVVEEVDPSVVHVRP